MHGLQTSPSCGLDASNFSPCIDAEATNAINEDNIEAEIDTLRTKIDPVGG